MQRIFSYRMTKQTCGKRWQDESLRFFSVALDSLIAINHHFNRAFRNELSVVPRRRMRCE